jgi:hypothetical protein
MAKKEEILLRKLIKETVEQLLVDNEDTEGAQEEPTTPQEEPAEKKTIIGFKSIFGDKDREGFSPILIPYFKAGAVLAIFLGELGDYKEFEAHRDIRIEAIEYFTKLEKLKQKFFNDDVYNSQEERQYLKREALTLLSQYTKIQPLLKDGLDLYNKFLDQGRAFLYEYANLYKRNMGGRNIYCTEGHLARVATAYSFFRGGSDTRGARSLGILMMDFLAYVNGHNIDSLARKKENGVFDNMPAKASEEEFNGNFSGGKNAALRVISHIVDECISDVTRMINNMTAKNSIESKQKDINESFVLIIQKYADENNLNPKELGQCVQKALLGDEMGTRKYMIAMAKKYKPAEADGGQLNEDFHGDSISVTPSKDKLYEMVENGEIDAAETAKNLIQFISEDDAKRYMEVYELDYEEENEEDNTEADQYAGF